MNRELYLDKNTFFHRLDPRTKVFILLLELIIVLFFKDPSWMGGILLLVIVHAGLSKSFENIRLILRIILVVAISGPILWNLFSSGPTKLFWIFTYESLLYSISRSMLMITMMIAGMVFISTTKTEEFILAMIKLGVPYRVAFAISTSVRLVPMILNSTYTVIQAQQSRGLNLSSGSIFERIKKYIPLFAPVFISTIRGTNELGMALESKGFGGEKRNFFIRIKFQRNDYLSFVMIALILIIASLLRHLGYGDIPGLIRG